MNGSELYQYILDNTLHELRGTWEVTQDNELKVTGSNVNGSYVVFPDALTNFRLEWDMTILSSGGYINSGISPIILSSYQGSNLEGWNDGSTVTNAGLLYYICNYRSTTNFGSLLTFINGTSQGNWLDSGYQDTFVVGTKYRYKLERKNGLFKLYQDNTLISSFTDPTNGMPIYIGWYMWYGGTSWDYQANFIIDNYVVTDLGTDITKYLNGIGLSEAWTNTKNYITAQLLGKSNTGHTHTKSEITDFPTIPSKTSDLTNDSGFLTSHQDLSGYVPRSGGAVMTGSLLASPTTSEIGFGYGWGNGGTIYTYSPTHSNAGWQGTIRLEPLKTTSNFKTMQLAPGGTWTWNGTACQITSDQRFKQQITEINDKLLDAWEDVELVQFKYNESVDTKGKSARLHTGYVVQQINKACTSHGVDITQYGLFCHEEYPKEIKEIEVVQKDGTKTKETKVIREANEHYSLRYTEALIVECKYLRRCIARLTARIEELEKGNNIK